MSKIDPTKLDIGDKLIVSGTDTRYDGTKGKVTAIFENKITLEIDGTRDEEGWSLVSTFPLDQLKRP